MKVLEHTSLGEQVSKKMSARILLLMAIITAGIFFISYLLSMQLFNHQVNIWKSVAPQNALTNLMDSDYFSIKKEMKFLESTRLFSSFVITDNQKRVISQFGTESFNATQLIPIKDEASAIWGYYSFTTDFYTFFSPLLITVALFSVLLLMLYFFIRWRIKTDLEKEFSRFNQFLKEIELVTERLNEIYSENNLPVNMKSSYNIEQEIINRAITRLLDEIKKANQSLREAILESEQKRFQEELTRTALQVAHDIGSPLAVLEAIVQSTSLAIPEENRVSLRNASSRIRDIAHSLLKKAKHDLLATPEGSLLQQHLHSLVSLVIAEKRLQYKNKLNINMDFHFDETAYGLFALIKVADFSRILSNLLNNAVEALDNGGTILISLSSDNHDVVISIRDNGRGVPKEVLFKLGTLGVTHGKEKGLGLGIYHAKNTIEAWGGKLTIHSELGQGAEVKIYLPMAQKPIWFLSEIKIADQQQIVVIDDDESIHEVWRRRFQQFQDATGTSIILKHFYSPHAFSNWKMSENDEEKNTIYLCDYEFIGSRENGIDLITKLKINYLSILVTSRFHSEELITKCEAFGIKLLSKEMAGIIPLIG